MFYNILASYPNNGYTNSSNAQATGGGINIGISLMILFGLAILIAFGLIAQKEAEKQNRNATGWFFLGFFFLINALIALKVSKAADEEGHDMGWWSFLGIVLGLSAIIAFESGLNAENKQHDFDCWVFLGFAGGLLALFVSCFLKPFEKKVVLKNESGQGNKIKPSSNGTWHCSKCGAVNLDSRSYCGVCGKQK